MLNSRKLMGNTIRLFLSIQTAMSCQLMVVGGDGGGGGSSDISRVSFFIVFNSDKGREISKSDRLCKSQAYDIRWSVECCKLRRCKLQLDVYVVIVLRRVIYWSSVLKLIRCSFFLFKCQIIHQMRMLIKNKWYVE